MATKKAATGGTKKKNAPLSKSALINALLEENDGLNRKQVKQVLESLESIGHKQLKKTNVFVVPGFAKFVVVHKKATPARMGRNPATGEEIQIAAKPARKVVRARPVKAIKVAID
jgi:nucleoid DNA-binding protein